jgi:redox-sensitive bicupin YhaK (pirin superfamily)
MSSITKTVKALGPVWETSDPFLFCVHHQDAYPKANGQMGPAASLAGRNIGQDFDPHAQWRMYHGRRVPGFPEHPHRGFETVTIVLQGLVDHFDSAGASGRYGHGDVQWMTAGSGLQHSEMFSLVDEHYPNPLELFQIWLNLPRASKFVDPHYKMLWSEDIPVVRSRDRNGRSTGIRIIAGHFGEQQAPAPAPDSWARTSENLVAIWLITMDAQAETVLPAAGAQSKRTLFFFEGSSIQVGDTEIPSYHAAEVQADQPVPVKNGPEPARILLLQGNPIAEPVAQYGPFVMNTREELQQAYDDFRRTRFGGWPWDRSDPVHPASQGRFARYHDGRVETRGQLR